MEEENKAYTLEDITTEFNKNNYEMDPQEVVRKASECEENHLDLNLEYNNMVAKIQEQESQKGNPKHVTPTELNEFIEQQNRATLPGTDAIENVGQSDESMKNFEFNIQNPMINNEQSTRVTMQDVPSNENIQDDMSGNRVTIQGLDDELENSEKNNELDR